MLDFFNSGLEVIELLRKPTKEQEQISDIIQQLVAGLDSSYSLMDKIEIESELQENSLEDMLRKDNSLLASLWEHESFINDHLLPFDEQILAYYQELEEKKTIIFYYVEPKPAKQRVDYYIFTPDWVTILRVPQSELGAGVLGVAYIGLNLVKILETLYGADFREVKKHELLHLKYPQKSEREIRQQTKQELSYQTRYQ